MRVDDVGLVGLAGKGPDVVRLVHSERHDVTAPEEARKRG
jgi:hypothetical protein